MPRRRRFTLLDCAQHPQRRHGRHRTSFVEQATPPVGPLPREVDARQQLVESVIIAIAPRYMHSTYIFMAAHRPPDASKDMIPGWAERTVKRSTSGKPDDDHHHRECPLTGCPCIRLALGRKSATSAQAHAGDPIEQMYRVSVGRDVHRVARPDTFAVADAGDDVGVTALHLRGAVQVRVGT